MPNSEITEEFLYDPDWALSELLSPSEKVVNIDHICSLEASIANTRDKIRHYSEQPDVLDLLERIATDLKFIRMGARP